MSNQTAERIKRLVRRPDFENLSTAHERRSPSAAPLPAVATSDEIAQLHEALEQQNELLRAILASSVDTQTDARATAQNSRTFAWAGTAIALLTLVATVIAIVAAVNGH
jgi:hypothetical protein